MNMPRWLSALGYLGLLPFLAGPLMLTLRPHAAPGWLQGAWINYVILIAAFLAGSLWGFGVVIVSQGGSGLAVVISTALMLLIWAATWLNLVHSLYALIVIFLLLLAADVWRERTLGHFADYLRLRSLLTIGALAALVWRLALL